MNDDDEMIQWEKNFRREHPIATSDRLGKIATIAAGVFILAIPASLIVIGVHWLFTRWW